MEEMRGIAKQRPNTTFDTINEHHNQAFDRNPAAYRAWLARVMTSKTQAATDITTVQRKETHFAKYRLNYLAGIATVAAGWALLGMMPAEAWDDGRLAIGATLFTVLIPILGAVSTRLHWTVGSVAIGALFGFIRRLGYLAPSTSAFPDWESLTAWEKFSHGSLNDLILGPVIPDRKSVV